MEKMILVIMICQLTELTIIAINDIITQVQYKKFIDRALETPSKEDIEKKLQDLADDNTMTFIDVDKVESE